MSKTKEEAEKNYICPMHPEERSGKPGRCSICGMNLVEVGKETHTDHKEHEQKEVRSPNSGTAF